MFKKHMTPIGRNGTLTRNYGKGASEELLPHKKALSSLTTGDPLARTMQHYGKATPMGNPLANADNEFLQLGE